MERPPPLNVVAPGRAAQPGYDHDWFPFEPLPQRAPWSWPDGASVAICLLVPVRAAEWEETAPVVAVPGGRGQAPYPDFPRMSHREFGHRVGIFRLAALLGSLGLPWSAALDVLTAEQYRTVAELVMTQAREVMAGGLSASRAITSAMSRDEESDYIGVTLDRLERVLGRRVRSWQSPQGSESWRTPGLLNEHGVTVLADWCNDEQPYPVSGAGDLWNVPVSWELDDVASMFVRGVEPRRHVGAVLDAVDTLAREGIAGRPRLLCLSLHPWLSGEPFRARAWRETLSVLAGRDDLWWATPTEAVEHLRRIR